MPTSDHRALTLANPLTPQTHRSASAPLAAVPYTSPWTMCRAAARQVEDARSLPPLLLTALTLTETGRPKAGQNRLEAWPWTVYANGRGHHYGTKDQAIAAARHFLAQGYESIDVGCMQINLKFHPRAFASMEEAFDPVSNASYAASLLSGFEKKTGSYTQAVAWYHSYNPRFNQAYAQKVMGLWMQEKHQVLLKALPNSDA